MRTRTIDPAALLSHNAQSARSSAIRDLLDHARRADVISMAGGMPDPATFDTTGLSAAAAAAAADPAALQYGPTQGEEATRAVLAGWTGTSCNPEHVVVTTGSQQGLDLVTRTLLDPGDTAVVAASDYLGTLQCLQRAGARLARVPCDADGIVVDRLAELLTAGLRPKLVSVVAHFGNPTGATVAAERADKLTELAEQYNFVVVEDDPYRELWFEQPPGGVIGDGSDHVVRLRSTSKILAPGLRIGWVVAPSWLTQHLVVAKQSTDIHTSTLTQAIVTAALADQHKARERIAHIRDRYRRRRDALIEALKGELAVEPAIRPAGGMFCWIDLGPGIDTQALLGTALDAGVAFVPGAAFEEPGRTSSRLRLSFATVDEPTIYKGVRRLAKAIETHAQTSAPRPPRARNAATYAGPNLNPGTAGQAHIDAGGRTSAGHATRPSRFLT